MSTVFVAIPFNPARGVPQTVPVDIGGRRFAVTLVASATDLPALRSVAGTDRLVDLATEQRSRPTAVPADARAWVAGPAHPSLSSAIVRPHLAVREQGTVLGSRSVVLGRPLLFGSTGHTALAVEIVVDALTLTAGSLTRPGDTGAAIAARLGLRTAGVSRHARPAASEEDPYDQLR